MNPRPLGSVARVLGLAVGLAALLAPSPPATAQAPPPPPPARTAPAPGQVLTLPEAIALALRQHPSIRATLESRNAAEARIPQARSAYFPKFDWVSSANRSKIVLGRSRGPIPGRYAGLDPATGQYAGLDQPTPQEEAATRAPMIASTTHSSLLSTGIEGSQLLFDSGRTTALVEDARAGLRASDAELDRIRQAVVLTVRQSYLLLLQARRLVAVTDSALARAELNLRSARGFFEVGTKPKSDVTKAEVEVANARVNVIRTRNAVRLAETSLANAIGLEATTPFEVQDILAFTPAVFDPAALRTDALKNRPELVQAKARLDSAEAQVTAARAAFGPELSVIGAYGGSTEDHPLHERWSIGARLTLNIFQGGFMVGKLREAQSLAETARANYDTLELQVRLDVEQAHLNVVEAAERIAATEKAVESATENLRLAQGRYDAGVGTILDLTDAQLALTAVEADLVRALTDHQVGLAVLDRAAGRQ